MRHRRRPTSRRSTGRSSTCHRRRPTRCRRRTRSPCPASRRTRSPASRFRASRFRASRSRASPISRSAWVAGPPAEPATPSPWPNQPGPPSQPSQPPPAWTEPPPLDSGQSWQPRITPSPPRRGRLGLGILIGVLAGLLVFGTAGYFTGNYLASPEPEPSTTTAPRPTGSMGAYEAGQLELNRKRFTGDLAVISEPWLAWVGGCAQQRRPLRPETRGRRAGPRLLRVQQRQRLLHPVQDGRRPRHEAGRAAAPEHRREGPDPGRGRPVEEDGDVRQDHRHLHRVRLPAGHRRSGPHHQRHLVGAGQRTRRGVHRGRLDRRHRREVGLAARRLAPLRADPSTRCRYVWRR